MFDYQTRRKWIDRTMVFLCGAAAFIAMLPLGFVLFYVLQKGIKLVLWAGVFILALALAVFILYRLYKALQHLGGRKASFILGPVTLILLGILYFFYQKADFTFFLQTQRPVGEPGGGMANAILGTLEIIVMASLVGLPIGIMAGIYLSEFGKKNKFAWAVRFTCDVLSGVPSIVTGIVAYTLIVRFMIGHFAGVAGGVALGFMMIPIVTRTTEELIKMVPHSIREASWALGVPQWKTVLSIVVRTAKNGILTGILLSIARVAGETAPLLFTALGNSGFSWPTQPTASLTVQVYNYAISPYEDWRNQAWTGALVLLVLVLTINLAAKLYFKNPRSLLR